MLANVLALLGFTIIAVAIGHLFGVWLALLVVVGPVLLLAAYVAHHAA